MPQFDVYRNPRGGTYPLVLDVQADLLAQLDTRVVVPMAPRERYAAELLRRATPVATVAGTEYVLVVPLLAAVARSALGKPVGSLASRRADLMSALDLMFTGS
jgi:toxin CcdB